jgi:hypothetical protein
MKNNYGYALVLTVAQVFAIGGANASGYDDRVRAERSAKERQHEQLFMAATAESNRELRQKVYQFSYFFTQTNDPRWAQRASCYAETYTSCGIGMCFSDRRSARNISVDELERGVYYVHGCDVNLNGYECNIYQGLEQSADKVVTRPYKARCIGPAPTFQRLNYDVP